MLFAWIDKCNSENLRKRKSIIFTHVLLLSLFFFPAKCSKIPSFIISFLFQELLRAILVGVGLLVINLLVFLYLRMS